MNRRHIPQKKRPEQAVQDRVRDYLHCRGWFTIKTHGSEYQQGLPDLFCTHSMFSQRWIEIKVLESYSFTPAQMDNFPKLVANGAGVWILVDATEEEYQKLFKPCNWWHYLSNMR